MPKCEMARASGRCEGDVRERDDSMHGMTLCAFHAGYFYALFNSIYSILSNKKGE
jgi:hypothetical protein